MINWDEDIVEAIARRRCAIVIGSGVSANSKGNNGASPPTWKAFLTEGAAQVENSQHITDAIDANDLLEACDYLKSAMGNRWSSFLREHFSTPRYKTAEIHKQIFELDARIVISLNFDNIYDRFANNAAEGTVIVKNYYDEDIREAVSGSDRYIIKPHGTIDTLSKIIFTLDDYARARVEHSSFYQVLNSVLHTNMLLFFGCGLNDPDIRTLFEDYRYTYDEMPHYITQSGPVHQAKVELVKRTRGLNIIEYSSAAGHRELTDSIRALVSLVNEKRDRIASERSW